MNKSGISPAASKRIVEAINFKLFENGFTDKNDPKIKLIRLHTIGVADLVKRIVLEDINGKFTEPTSVARGTGSGPLSSGS